jgi:outer membrane protein assembly factor BamB
MRSTSRSIGVVMACFVLISMGRVLAQDWPQWRGPNRDGKVTGFTVPQTWPKALTPKWKTTVGLGDGTPALVGDKLYVLARQGEQEVMLCLNAVDGKEIWQDRYTAQVVTGASARHPGPRSSPAVADGKVVALGVGGVLSCFDAATGKIVWRKDEFTKIEPSFWYALSPVLVDGMCIVHVAGKEKDKGEVIAFDLTSGDQKWKWAGDAPSNATPALMTAAGTKQIVVETAKNIVGLALADGRLLWQLEAAPQQRFFNAPTPVVDGDIVIYTGQGKGTRAVKVERQGDGFVTREQWSNEKVGTKFDTPILKGGLLFGMSDKGSFFCLNAKTGEVAWTDTVIRRDGFDAILDAGSVIVALPSTSELIAFKPSEKQYEELARIKVADTPTYAHPVLAGNRVFVKDQDAVTMWTIE